MSKTAVAKPSAFRQALMMMVVGAVDAHPMPKLAVGVLVACLLLLIPATASATNIGAWAGSACVLLDGGAVKCWGNNMSGELGNGTTDNSSTPVFVTGVTNAISIAAGNASTCAVLADGTIKCWGDNSSGQLGNGSPDDSLAPVSVSGINDAKAISSGRQHSCALLASHTVRCWGTNADHVLGIGVNVGSSAVPTPVAGIHNATSIVASTNHSCALVGTGAMKCWGNSQYGQLGNESGDVVWRPESVNGISGASSIAVGEYYSCAVVASGTPKCWGSNMDGRLGDGTPYDSMIPVAVTGVTTVSAAHAGDVYACGAGEAACGNDDDEPAPAGPWVARATTLSASSAHTCAVLETGAVKCWGENGSGQLGTGNTESSSSPVAVSGISTATSVAVNGFHSCALLAGDSVKCWGENSSGQLGGETGGLDALTPIDVAGLANVVGITSGYEFGCAVLADGSVRCWGDNQYGQLGDGSTDDSPTPVAVDGINNAVSVVADTVHACALLANHTVKCWGQNDRGQLGSGNGDNSTTPVAVDGVTTAVSLAAGLQHSCAVLAGGSVKCWGDNQYGALGIGLMGGYAASPLRVANISNVTRIAVGDGSTCAVLTSRAVRCWGHNEFGQLGDGSTDNSATPVAVSGIGTAVDVAHGFSYACSVLVDKTIKCWGNNDWEQLGDGTRASSTIPVSVLGIANALILPEDDDDDTPPATCAVGQTGTPPNCVTPPVATCAAGQTGTPPNCVTTTAPQPVGVPPVRRIQVPAMGSRIGAIARTGSVPITVPVPESGTTVRMQMVVTAAQARALGLKVPRKARTLVIGTATIQSAKAGQTIAAKVVLTKAARNALRTHSKVKTLKTTLTMTFAKKGRKPSTLTKPVTFKR